MAAKRWLRRVSEVWFRGWTDTRGFCASSSERSLKTRTGQPCRGEQTSCFLQLDCWGNWTRCHRNRSFGASDESVSQSVGEVSCSQNFEFRCVLHAVLRQAKESCDQQSTLLRNYVTSNVCFTKVDIEDNVERNTCLISCESIGRSCANIVLNRSLCLPMYTAKQ